jgi:hypothetical protein
MVLTVVRVDSTICYFPTLWDLVLVIVPHGKTRSYIQSGLSRREASSIVTGREVENVLKEFGWGGMEWITNME